MKGVIFNIFEGFITEGWGEEAYEALLDECPLHTQEPFVGPGTYPDSDLVSMLTQACENHGVSAPDALRAFGKYCFPHLASKFPKFVDMHDHPKPFLMSVHDIIHVEVRKLFKDAITPSFAYQDTGPDSLVIEYTSDRKLCFLMEGLLAGVAEHFGVSIDTTQTRCTHEGAEACDFDLRFAA